jgi:hypothetical protein
MVFSGFLFGLVVGGWDFGFSGWGDEIPDRDRGVRWKYSSLRFLLDEFEGAVYFVCGCCCGDVERLDAINLNDRIFGNSVEFWRYGNGFCF